MGFLLGYYTPEYYARLKHPIWVGKQKRGNRRNRSRFNFRR